MSAHAAEGEARAKHAGSKALRATALRGLRRLIAAVGDGDALAFVLPGVASGLLRALLLAGALAHSPQKIEAAVCRRHYRASAYHNTACHCCMLRVTAVSDGDALAFVLLGVAGGLLCTLPFAGAMCWCYIFSDQPADTPREVLL